MSQDIYEVYAVKYATRDGTRSANFIGGDPHDGPMPMDYFVWLVRNAERTFVVDVGFSEAMARQRKRTFLRTPSEGLALLGVRAATVKISRMRLSRSAELKNCCVCPVAVIDPRPYIEPLVATPTGSVPAIPSLT